MQGGGALLLAAALPLVVRVLVAGDLASRSVQSTFVGTVIAVLASTYLFRSVVVHPGVRQSYFVVPLAGLAYAAVLLALFLFRVDYSRFLLITSFTAQVGWLYTIYFMLRRSRYRIGLVPFQNRDELLRLGAVDWYPLDDPDELPPLDAVVADLSEDMPDEWERFLADTALAGVAVLHHKQLLESLTGRVKIDHLSENNFGSLVPALIYVKPKRLLDLVVSVLALVVLAPFLTIIAILIRIDSAGPAVFKQVRVGYRGRSFVIYKFRTMRVDQDRSDDRRAAMTQDGDDRVTRIGRYLRRTRLDELPQLLNIAMGDMALIGPRPEAEPLSQWYEAQIPFYRYRHIVRPGLTGWAQVNQGHVAEVDDVLRKLEYDFYYIKNFSPWLDLLIVVQTVRTMLTGFGSR